MRGGKLQITKTTVFDLGSGESSKILKELEISEPDGSKESAFELESGFEKSFLSKIIQLKNDNYGTVGITTYDSYNDYLANKISGQGLFEKVDCKKLKP